MISKYLNEKELPITLDLFKELKEAKTIDGLVDYFLSLENNLKIRCLLEKYKSIKVEIIYDNNELSINSFFNIFFVKINEKKIEERKGLLVYEDFGKTIIKFPYPSFSIWEHYDKKSDTYHLELKSRITKA